MLYRIAAMTLAWVLPSKARRPVSISKSTPPSAKMSVRASTSPASSCSGAMYGAVPSIVPSWVRVLVSPTVLSENGLDGVRLRDAEVEQLGAGAREHDVGRLQIAVDDASAMGAIQRVGDLRGDLQRLRDGQCTPREPVFEGFPFHELEHEVVEAVLTADIVKRADMWVGEPGDRASLALEPLARERIARHVRRQDLDGNRPVQSRVARLEDLAHAAGGDPVNDFVRSQPAARCDRHARAIIRRAPRSSSGIFRDRRALRECVLHPPSRTMQCAFVHSAWCILDSAFGLWPFGLWPCGLWKPTGTPLLSRRGSGCGHSAHAAGGSRRFRRRSPPLPACSDVGWLPAPLRRPSIGGR